MPFDVLAISKKVSYCGSRLISPHRQQSTKVLVLCQEESFAAMIGQGSISSITYSVVFGDPERPELSTGVPGIPMRMRDLLVFTRLFDSRT